MGKLNIYIQEKQNKNAVQQCITAITADSTTSESTRNC